MNCTDCKDLISPFMESDLDEERSALVRSHLSECSGCAQFCEELASMIDLCRAEEVTEIPAPASRAMWLRINNIIENEANAAAARPEPEGPKRRFWQLTLPQLASAVLCIAVISSLLTVVAVRNYSGPPDVDLALTPASLTTFEKVMGKLGLVETPQDARERRLKELHTAIEYWNTRVQARRLQWDTATRAAFDRNLQVIDESVAEYNFALERDPEDELSGEMLDAVLDDKMSLLRDFADL